MTKQEAEKLGITPPVPDFREVGLDKKFANRVIRYATLGEQIKVLEEERKELSGEIGADITAVGETVVMCDNRRVAVCEGKNTTINKEKLLELGVPVKTILAATVIKQYTYVLVGKEKL
jgi:hypothetical protein